MSEDHRIVSQAQADVQFRAQEAERAAKDALALAEAAVGEAQRARNDAQRAERLAGAAERRAVQAEQRSQPPVGGAEKQDVRRAAELDQGRLQTILDGEQRLRAELGKDLAAARQRAEAAERARDTAIATLEATRGAITAPGGTQREGSRT